VCVCGGVNAFGAKFVANLDYCSCYYYYTLTVSEKPKV
jgi:hypothetical protein